MGPHQKKKKKITEMLHLTQGQSGSKVTAHFKEITSETPVKGKSLE